MVAQRQPVDRVIDLAVGLPVVTLIAARRSIPLIRQASRQGIRHAARRVRRGRTSESTTVASQTASAPPLGSTGNTRNKPAKSGVSTEPSAFQVAAALALPIDDYDHLAARQVVARLSTLSAAELAQVDTYERANRHRQTVLGRISQLQS